VGKMTLELKGTIPRGTSHELRIYQGEYYGKKVIDIRWYEERNGEMTPTRKGVRFNIDEAQHVKDIINKIVGEKNEESIEF
jgi:hypothetical protein